MMMMIFKDAMYSFFYSSTNVYGPSILLSYAPLALVFCLNHITCSVMQGINKQRYLFISLILGISLKYLYNQPLIEAIGYNGAIISTLIGLLATIISNFIAIKHTLRFNHVYMIRRLLIIFGLNIIIIAI